MPKLSKKRSSGFRLKRKTRKTRTKTRTKTKTKTETKKTRTKKTKVKTKKYGGVPQGPDGDYYPKDVKAIEEVSTEIKGKTADPMESEGKTADPMESMESGETADPMESEGETDDPMESDSDSDESMTDTESSEGPKVPDVPKTDEPMDPRNMTQEEILDYINKDIQLDAPRDSSFYVNKSDSVQIMPQIDALVTQFEDHVLKLSNSERDINDYFDAFLGGVNLKREKREGDEGDEDAKRPKPGFLGGAETEPGASTLSNLTAEQVESARLIALTLQGIKRGKYQKRYLKDKVEINEGQAMDVNNLVTSAKNGYVAQGKLALHTMTIRYLIMHKYLCEIIGNFTDMVAESGVVVVESTLHTGKVALFGEKTKEQVLRESIESIARELHDLKKQPMIHEKNRQWMMVNKSIQKIQAKLDDQRKLVDELAALRKEEQDKELEARTKIIEAFAAIEETNQLYVESMMPLLKEEIEGKDDPFVDLGKDLEEIPLGKIGLCGQLNNAKGAVLEMSSDFGWFVWYGIKTGLLLSRDFVATFPTQTIPTVVGAGAVYLYKDEIFRLMATCAGTWGATMAIPSLIGGTLKTLSTAAKIRKSTEDLNREAAEAAREAATLQQQTAEINSGTATTQQRSEYLTYVSNAIATGSQYAAAGAVMMNQIQQARRLLGN